jgi:hypothetical protein
MMLKTANLPRLAILIKPNLTANDTHSAKTKNVGFNNSDKNFGPVL